MPADDEAALRAALLRLIGDDRLRAQLATRARQQARTFTTSRMLASYLGLYEELLSQRQARRRPFSLALAGSQPGYEG